MFDVVFLIAGKGERTNLPYNKVFHKINNKFLFMYALEKFIDLKECEKIVIVTNQDDFSKLNSEFDLDNQKIEITLGGEYRQDSVNKGIKLCKNEIVLIHDGARPNITKNEILKVYEQTLIKGAAVLAVKTKETIKQLVDGKIVTLDRTNLYNIQTPQGVKKSLYNQAVTMAKKDNYYATDDVGLLEKYLFINPEIVLGSYENIKVTTIEDIKYLEFLLKEEK